jgi:hypothetical protein
MAEEKTFHCDGWYFEHVCLYRGAEDVSDIRKDKKGFIRDGRFVCKSKGIKWSGLMCEHCIEYRKYFKQEK